MTQTDKILWLDLETTGSTLSENLIIEVGIVLTDATPNLTIIDERNWLLPANIERRRISDMDPTVIEMHARSGLWRELIEHPFQAIGNRATDDMIDAWLEELGISSEHIPLAGSGVSHFDRPYIRRDLPKLDKRLTYWAYDVGVIRRSLSNLTPGFPVISHAEVPHRALGDIHLQLDEMRKYICILGDGVAAHLREKASAQETVAAGYAMAGSDG